MYPFPDSNGPAFTKKEERSGPPLDYVGEKLRSAIEAAHANINNIKSFVPSDLPREPEFNECAPENIKNDMLLSSASAALYLFGGFILGSVQYAWRSKWQQHAQES